MKILGKTKNNINLEVFINSICSDYDELEKNVDKFLAENHEWKVAANDSAEFYYNDLNLSYITADQAISSKELGVSEYTVLLANKITILILFGYSHYLESVGYNISNPVDFAEISSKLSFARMAIVRLGYYLLPKNHHKQISKREELSLLQHGFGIGATLGYLTDCEH